jgi:hypothetical protein
MEEIVAMPRTCASVRGVEAIFNPRGAGPVADRPLIERSVTRSFTRPNTERLVHREKASTRECRSRGDARRAVGGGRHALLAASQSGWRSAGQKKGRNKAR